jgi:hypothetical protein
MPNKRTPADKKTPVKPETKRGNAAAAAVRGPKSPDLSAGTNQAKSLRRIPLTRDVLSPAEGTIIDVMEQKRMDAITHLYLGFDDAAKQLDLIKNLPAVRALPGQLIGTLLEPDGNPAVHVQLSAKLPGVSSGGSSRVVLTDDHGAFRLGLPRPMYLELSKSLTLAVHGSNTSTEVVLKLNQIATNGMVGNVNLPVHVAPLQVSIVESLKDLLPAEGGRETTPPYTPPEEQPKVNLGEEEKCLIRYGSYSFDKFPFSVFVRLIEPRTSIVTSIMKIFVKNEKLKKYLPKTIWNTELTMPPLEKRSFVDRVPVEQPISVDGFRDQIVGVDGGTTVTSAETVPVAATLGLGYIVQMAQLWTLKDYVLGDLVYSLPLAPGQQQRVAIFERLDVAGVRESEFLTAEEQQAAQQRADSSTEATFSSSFNELARGGSHFDTQSSSSSWGASIIVASGGGGSSKSSGNSSSWLQGHRDSIQRASEDMHSATQRQASARRTAARTSMRLATASESASVVTKVITNHNHTRALTLQYWEVLRRFEVSTDIVGVTLVCLVPLEIVRFLLPGQPMTLGSPALIDTRAEVLRRYSLVQKHADVLIRSLPRAFHYGLTLLRQFAADPTAEVQPAGGPAEDVIDVILRGTFLPFEEIYISAVTRRGTRIGPTRLEGVIGPVPEVRNDLNNSFPTRDALLGYLRSRRNQARHTIRGSLAIPPSLSRNDIIGFEFSRRFQPWDYDLINEVARTAKILGIEIPVGTRLVSSTVRFSPQELESELGGPQLGAFHAYIHGGTETYANESLNGVELPPQPLPIPAAQLAPVLRYSQVLEIERMLQHVVQNTVSYSKAVWWSLTPEERAIMLEGFTIGVPSDGIADETQMVPLLNCVENRVLGFYGNSMIMPFFIPRSVEDTKNISTSQIQGMLMSFHATAFSPPKSTVTLPTRGVLGEAMLGHCPSAEKIDLTRFWNWADSPSDTAPEIAAVTVPTTQPSLAAGLTAPSTLTGMPPLINNFNAGSAAPAADTGLLQAMIKAAAEQKDFSTELTGAALLAPLIKGSQETAEKARADALKTTKDLQAQAMATAGNIVGGIYGGNPTAGSDALKALSGGGGEKPKTDEKKTEQTPAENGTTDGDKKTKEVKKKTDEKPK